MRLEEGAIIVLEILCLGAVAIVAPTVLLKIDRLLPHGLLALPCACSQLPLRSSSQKMGM